MKTERTPLNFKRGAVAVVLMIALGALFAAIFRQVAHWDTPISGVLGTLLALGTTMWLMRFEKRRVRTLSAE